MLRRSLVVLDTLACVATVWAISGPSTPFAPLTTGPAPETAMLDAARAFLKTLDAGQVQQVSFPFDDEERFRWFYTPVERKGLPFKAMTPTQQQAALALLRTGLSEKGFSKADTIRKIELVLREMEKRDSRDPELYFFSIFGTPSERGTWGWRFEGHHLSHHWTIVNGKAIATTPQFFGVNPAHVRSGAMQGTRALAVEEDLGRALVTSLSDAQRADAIVSATAPRDVLTTNVRQAAIQEDRGVAYAALGKEQRATLMKLVEEYAHAQAPSLAEARLKTLGDAGLDRIKFAWMGGIEPGQGHYYRIQGPTFLIEYDNTQNSANHIHTVWRDFKGDFGLDLLAEHYRSARHQDDQGLGTRREASLPFPAGSPGSPHRAARP